VDITLGGKDYSLERETLKKWLQLEELKSKTYEEAKRRNIDGFSACLCSCVSFILGVDVSELPWLEAATAFSEIVYVNEPSECKWSREDRDYDNMENEMNCNTFIWEMNNQNVYTCRTNLTGIENRKENEYYFRCKDQPWAVEGDRNVNVHSYLYKIIGTQPLNILNSSY